MEECKQIELTIFKKVIEVCERHNLRYIVDYGSLIGVVRHGGFIPWDDDIDISMPRPDYELFKEYFEQEKERDSRLELRTGMIANVVLPYIQIVDRNTITEKKGRRDAFAQAVWVDVFPVDGAGNCLEQQEEIYYNYWENIKKIRQIIGRYKPYLNPFKQIRQFYWHHIKKYQLKALLAETEKQMQHFDYETSERVFCYCTVYGSNEKNHKKYYEDRISMEFEGISCKVPREYDEKLRGIYGDYRVLPSEENRKGHEFTAYYLS